MKMADKNDIYSSSDRMDYGDGFYVHDRTKTKQYYDEHEEPDEEHEPQPQKPKKGCFVRFLSFILILAAIILILSGIYIIIVLSRVNYSHDTIEHSSGIELKSKSGVENILIFGEDNHQDGKHGRSDSIILLTIDKNTKKLKLTSFMRDLYVYIPDYGYDKLNAAYAYGGAKLAAETVEYNFHIRIDNYLIVDFQSFTDMIDAVGGIDLALSREEIEYINWQSYRNHQVDTEMELDPDSYDYDYTEENGNTALVHLNGRQALWYARDRDSAGSDFDRTQRQRTVINTVLSKLSSNPLLMPYTGYSISAYLTTNMNPAVLTDKGFDLLFSLKYERQEHRVPMSSNYYDDWTESGQVLVIADENDELEALYDFVFEQ